MSEPMSDECVSVDMLRRRRSLKPENQRYYSRDWYRRAAVAFRDEADRLRTQLAAAIADSAFAAEVRKQVPLMESLDDFNGFFVTFDEVVETCGGGDWGISPLELIVDLRDTLDETTARLAAAEAVCEELAACRVLAEKGDESEDVERFLESYAAVMRKAVAWQSLRGGGVQLCFNCATRPRTHGQLCETCASGAKKLLGELGFGGDGDAS